MVALQLAQLFTASTKRYYPDRFSADGREAKKKDFKHFVRKYAKVACRPLLLRTRVHESRGVAQTQRQQIRAYRPGVSTACEKSVTVWTTSQSLTVCPPPTCPSQHYVTSHPEICVATDEVQAHVDRQVDRYFSSHDSYASRSASRHNGGSGPPSESQ